MTDPRGQAHAHRPDGHDQTRPADILAIFAAALGSPDTPQCAGVHWFESSKLNCGRAEMETTWPRPLCTAAEIAIARECCHSRRRPRSLCTVCL